MKPSQHQPFQFGSLKPAAAAQQQLRPVLPPQQVQIQQQAQQPFQFGSAASLQQQAQQAPPQQKPFQFDGSKPVVSQPLPASAPLFSAAAALATASPVFAAKPANTAAATTSVPAFQGSAPTVPPTVPPSVVQPPVFNFKAAPTIQPPAPLAPSFQPVSAPFVFGASQPSTSAPAAAIGADAGALGGGVASKPASVAAPGPSFSSPSSPQVRMAHSCGWLHSLIVVYTLLNAFFHHF